MKGIVLALSATLTALWLSPVVSAQPLCEHRSEAHAAQQHTTREGDSRWHVLHGQLPTCNLDQKDDHDDHPSDDRDTDHTPFHRDHEGIHCFHFHCG